MAKYWYDVHKIAYVEEIELMNATATYSGNSWLKVNGINQSTGFYNFGQSTSWSFDTGSKYAYPLSASKATPRKQCLLILSDRQGLIRGDLYQIIATKSDFINRIKAEENEFPADGFHENYWYVRGDKAFPSLKLNGQTIGGAKIKDSTGQVRTVGNVYFKDSSGIVRNLR